MSGTGFTNLPLNKYQWAQYALDQALNDPTQPGGEDNATSLDNALDD